MPPQPPTYQQIADDLRAKIEGGQYAPGDLLPTLAALKEEYGVGGVNTVRQGLDVLAAEGLVDSRGGRRTKVTTPEPSEAERVQAQIADLQEQIRELRERLAEHEAGH